MKQVDADLDAVDRFILDIIQSDFPLSPRPYAVIAQQIGISEQEAFTRTRRLRKSGVIRRMGTNFDSSHLGFKSTLCAAKVPHANLDTFITAVNACPGVTDNYLRSHEYNVWFTLIGPSWNSVCASINELSQKTGIHILNLPKTRLYKIKVNFEME